MSNHVDTIQVEITGFSGGQKLYVEDFELVIAVGAIPRIIMSILPVEAPAKGPGQYITASAPNIDEISRLYRQLMQEVTQLNSTATIKLTVVSNDKKNPVANEESDQSVTLEKWILTDVGLSSLTTTASPVLTVVFSHPSVMLDKSGMIYEEVENDLKLPEVYSKMSDENLIAFMDDLYEKFASSEDIVFMQIADKSFGGTEGQFIEKVKELRTGYLPEFKPGKYIDDKTDGLFMANICSSCQESMKETVGDLARPRAFCNSTWERLVRELCPYFTTAIIPTYTKPKLLHEPNSPWQKSTLRLTTPFIVALDMSPNDPNPLIGTAINKARWSSLHVAQDSLRSNPVDNQGDPRSFSFSFFFPDRAIGASYGDILNLGEARMIDNLICLDHAANKSNGGSLQDAGNIATDKDKADMDDAFAKAMYLINYRKNCISSIVTSPIFKDSNHKLLIPGRVVTVYDAETNKDLLNGYIVRIVVKGSTAGGSNATFSLSHVRPAGGNCTFVDEGTENPCYPEVSRD